MKKIDIICKRLKAHRRSCLEPKKKGIKLALETAKNNLEQQRDTAADEYENSLLKLADDNVDYKSVINQMIKHKQTMVDAENTIELIDQIKADLESEVKEEE